MIFFTGIHQPSDAGRVVRPFISVNRLLPRKAPMRLRAEDARILDSGAFTALLLHGDHNLTVEQYAAEICRWSQNGALLAAVAQDYMCESFMLERTGSTVGDHQRRTIERYDALIRCDTAGIYVMPVLQGFAPAEYVEHLRQYADRMPNGMWAGVGSVCKRNGTPAQVEDVLWAIKDARPDLRLHGFGLKTTALTSAAVRRLLYSADSMAWSYAVRRQGRNQNDWREAVRFAERIAEMICVDGGQPI